MRLSEILDKILSWVTAYKVAKAAKKKQRKKLKKVAICVGHSRIGDKGARSVGGVDEWDYNKKIADLLKANLRHQGYQSVVFDDYPAESYGAAMDWLAQNIQKEKCDIAIELHFNSYSSSRAAGYEYLYYDGSKEGKRLANCFLKSQGDTFKVQTSRGAKPIGSGQRGVSFLRSVPPPAVICEPFFGSCPKEWVLFEYKAPLLANVYAKAITEFFKA